MKLARIFQIAVLTCTSMSAIPIDNGIVGDGRFAVDILEAGDSGQGILTYGGGSTTDLIYRMSTLYRTGGGYTFLSGTTTSGPTQTGPRSVQSSGTFAGANGDIRWVANSFFNLGSPVLNTEFLFESGTPFGTVEILNYLDEDVLGAGGDNAVVFGTEATPGFQILTVEASEQLGVAHSADFNPSGAQYTGYGIQHCCGSYVTAIGGAINVSAIADPRFPGQPAYGTSDMTSNFSFLLDLDATSARLVFTIGGSPEGRPVPTVPEPGTISLFASGMAAAALFRLRRRRS